MADLRKRFGRLVAAHRRRRRMTQAALAEAANLSPDMVVKIENGASGARFPVTERIAKALEIDPAELFTTEIPDGAIRRGTFGEVSVRLAGLSELELKMALRVLDAIISAK
jgi:transcriptional regulator with XRE-family HTH domain